MTATTGKINVVATRGMELTCAGCRQRFRSREISLADDASSRAWCQECVRGVASPAEVRRWRRLTLSTAPFGMRDCWRVIGGTGLLRESDLERRFKHC
jgi:hypothetical protein